MDFKSLFLFSDHSLFLYSIGKLSFNNLMSLKYEDIEKFWDFTSPITLKYLLNNNGKIYKFKNILLTFLIAKKYKEINKTKTKGIKSSFEKKLRTNFGLIPVARYSK